MCMTYLDKQRGVITVGDNQSSSNGQPMELMLEHGIIQELHQAVPKLDVVTADGLDGQPKVSVLLRDHQWIRVVVVGECIRFLEQFHSSLAVIVVTAKLFSDHEGWFALGNRR